MFVPADILLEIAAHLDHCDVVSLSLVCCAWNTAFVPAVHSRLVYLVRHRYHHLSLGQYLAKYGHLIRELCVSDTNDAELSESTTANYLSLHAWLLDNCHRIIRLRVLPGGSPYYVTALLGFINAIPFSSNEHRRDIVEKCPESVALMFLKDEDKDNPITGWQYPFLGLDNLSDNFTVPLHWDVASGWLERLSIIGTDPPLAFILREWNKLEAMNTVITGRGRLSGWHINERKRILPAIRRLGPFAMVHHSPVEVEGLESHCNGALRRLCIWLRTNNYGDETPRAEIDGFDAAEENQLQNQQQIQQIQQIQQLQQQQQGHDTGVKVRPLQINEEVAALGRVELEEVASPDTYPLLDVRYIYLNARGGHRMTLVTQLFDVLALNNPMASVEYLTIVGAEGTIEWPDSNNLEHFMTPERLKCIPHRFPNLKWMRLEGLKVVDDNLLNEILYHDGDSCKRKMRLRKLRHVKIIQCSITEEGQQIINQINSPL